MIKSISFTCEHIPLLPHTPGFWNDTFTDLFPKCRRYGIKTSHHNVTRGASVTWVNVIVMLRHRLSGSAYLAPPPRTCTSTPFLHLPYILCTDAKRVHFHLSVRSYLNRYLYFISFYFYCCQQLLVP